MAIPHPVHRLSKRRSLALTRSAANDQIADNPYTRTRLISECVQLIVLTASVGVAVVLFFLFRQPALSAAD